MRNHWKEKWISWWTEWPDAKFPRNTHAAKTVSDLNLGKASFACYEGMFLASFEMKKIKDEQE